MKWFLSSSIEKVIKDNIKEVPYEGTEVNKLSLQEDIASLVSDVSVGFITWCFKNKVELRTQGYFINDKCYSRKDLFDAFISKKVIS